MTRDEILAILGARHRRLVAMAYRERDLATLVALVREARAILECSKLISGAER